ncbi:subclass B3 metallo-beta-lactamase [Altererythrobacter litoralis]|uniref:Subclass B3 metallo-beta-lactamase n=1 Tax=Altererythrobacter litoralis TaxID=3113904 RepID=A0ABU7GAX9_9SPHN|nr:subclass B3 metallo-beta-lactamase [Erythrobacteraceae bacterium 1XM1-14]
MFAKLLPAFALLLAGCAATASPVPAPAASEAMKNFATSCEDWDEWDKPAQPFKVYGNTYYVGTCGITALLITGPEGHVLIDTGTEPGARDVVENIAELGFKIEDIAVLTHSHEHFDHVGGFAYAKQLGTMKVAVARAAAEAFRTGNSDPADPQHGTLPPMAPVEVSREIDDGDVIRVGSVGLTALAMPGHTPGALSWTWQECDDGKVCRTIVYADSLSPVSADDYHFSDHPTYLADYRASLAKLAKLDCDILLTPHPSASDMISRAANGSFEGGMSCKDYAAAVTKRLDDRLAKEATAK